MMKATSSPSLKRIKKADDRVMKRVFALFLVMLAWASAYADGIASVFTSDNIPLFPTLEKNSRLDMVDYFAAGKKMEVQNKMGGKSQLIECSEEYLKVKTSDSSSTEMRLTELNGDTVIAVVRKYEVPQADAVLAFYSADWKELPLEKVIKLPVMADFINAPKKLKKELAEMIEFPLMTISIAEEGKIVFEPTVMEYLSIENAEKIKQYLIDKLVYVKKGNRYVLVE